MADQALLITEAEVTALIDLRDEVAALEPKPAHETADSAVPIDRSLRGPRLRRARGQSNGEAKMEVARCERHRRPRCKREDISNERRQSQVHRSQRLRDSET